MDLSGAACYIHDKLTVHKSFLVKKDKTVILQLLSTQERDLINCSCFKISFKISFNWRLTFQVRVNQSQDRNTHGTQVPLLLLFMELLVDVVNAA